jgi:hypothetical protein
MTAMDEPNGSRSGEPFKERDLRIGDRERDEVTQALHDAFAQGRITRDELDERLEATLTARTAGDLRRVTADLPGSHGSRHPYSPAWPADAPRPPHQPWPGYRGDLATWGHHAEAARRRAEWRAHRRARWSARRRGRPSIGLLILAALAISALVSGTAWPLIAAVKVIFFVWLAFAVTGLIHHRRWHNRHRIGP